MNKLYKYYFHNSIIVQNNRKISILTDKGDVLSESALVAFLFALNAIVRSTLPPFEDFFFFKPNFLLSFFILGESPSPKDYKKYI